MYCRRCGTLNDDGAATCVRCGEPLAEAAPKKIESYLALAILVTALCCMPFGVVGIVYAAQVKPKALAGDIAGAQEAARKARTWSLWGLGLGLALLAVYFLLALSGVLVESTGR